MNVQKIHHGVRTVSPHPARNLRRPNQRKTHWVAPAPRFMSHQQAGSSHRMNRIAAGLLAVVGMHYGYNFTQNQKVDRMLDQVCSMTETQKKTWIYLMLTGYADEHQQKAATRLIGSLEEESDRAFYYEKALWNPALQKIAMQGIQDNIQNPVLQNLLQDQRDALKKQQSPYKMIPQAFSELLKQIHRQQTAIRNKAEKLKHHKNDSRISSHSSCR